MAGSACSGIFHLAAIPLRHSANIPLPLPSSHFLCAGLPDVSVGRLPVQTPFQVIARGVCEH